MRRIRRNKRGKQKKVVIIGSLSLLIVMTIGYAAFSTNLNITAKGNVKEKSRVIQSWSSTDTTNFHSTFYKEHIVNITFLDNADVPNNATESWNVSEDKTHGGVMAWVIPNNEDNTKYDLYIGAKDGVIANKNSNYLFYCFVATKTINFGSNFDTSNTTSMYLMFSNCIELLTLDLSNFDTRNVRNMGNMFVGTVSNNPMKIETIIFGENFKTNNVTNMYAMFGNCNSLVNLDVSGFDTSNVTTMHDMFSSCHSLTNIDVSGFNTSKVTDMHGMFFACRSLTSLDLCSFDTSNVTDMVSMFQYITNLSKVTVGLNWSTTNANTNAMFTGSGISEVTTGQC